MMNKPLVEYKHPTDRGWAFVIVFAAGVSNFTVNGGVRTMGIVFVYLMEHFQSTQGPTSVVTAVLAAGFAIFACIGNIVGVRFTMRNVALMGAVLSMSGFFLTGFMPHIAYVNLTLGLMTGIGYGLLFGPSMVLIGQYCPVKLSLANGIAVSGGSIGQLVLPFFIGAVMKRYMFRGGMIMYAGLLLHGIPAMLLLTPPSFYGVKKTTSLPTGDDEINSATAEGAASTYPLNRPLAGYPSREQIPLNPRANDQQTPFSPPPAGYAPYPSYTLQDGRIQEQQHPVPAYPLRQTDSAPYFRRPSLSRPGGFSTEDVLRNNPELYRRASLAIPRSRPEVAAELNVPEETVTVKITAGVLMRKICDPVLVCNPVFLIYVLALSLGHAGFLGGCTFIAPYIKQTFNSHDAMERVIFVMGIGDLAGRLGGGIVAQWGYFRKTSLVGCSFVVTGVLALLVPFTGRNIWLVGTFAVVFGLFGGTYMAQIVAIVDELFGSVLLASSVGLSTMGMGLIGIPIMLLLGFMPSPAISVRVAGLLVILGGSLFYVLSLIAWWRSRKVPPPPVPGPESLDQKPERGPWNADLHDGRKEFPTTVAPPNSAQFASAGPLEESRYAGSDRSGSGRPGDGQMRAGYGGEFSNGSGNFARPNQPGHPHSRDLYQGPEDQHYAPSHPSLDRGYPFSRDQGYPNTGERYQGPGQGYSDAAENYAHEQRGRQGGRYAAEDPRSYGVNFDPSQDPTGGRFPHRFNGVDEQSKRNPGRPPNEKDRWSQQYFRFSTIPSAKESEML